MDEWLEGGSTDVDDGLTPRELEVVKLIAEAYTNKQIAETLKLSEKTVESHRTNVFGEARHARPRGDRALRDPARARRAVGRGLGLRAVVVLARAVEEERDGEQDDRHVEAHHQRAGDPLVLERLIPCSAVRPTYQS